MKFHPIKKKKQKNKKLRNFKRGFENKGIADFYNEDRKMAMHREQTVEAHEKEKRMKKLKDMGIIT
tara:strand:- start:1010 stop:1207 length:198 start_codon:yes stop_codon:yes gene_type:complete